jgi:hypothetical protein
MSCDCTEILAKLNELLTSGVALRFIKNATAHDLDITQDADSKWRLHVRESSEIELIPMSVAGVAIGAEVILHTFTASTYTHFAGFHIFKGNDSEYSVFLNGEQMGGFLLNFYNPKPFFQFPGKLPLQIGDVLEIKVLNTGLTPCDYAGSLIKEV